MAAPQLFLPEAWRRVLPWARRPDPAEDHGHRPYAAWEAELTAYARLRTAATIKIAFAMATEAHWSDEISLARPDSQLSIDDAFRHAELELEHLLAHYRHGWRELALFWRAWTRPAERITLPWPPWDKVELPAGVLLAPLTGAVPGLKLPDKHEFWAPRLRDATAWLSAAWCDGAHRLAETTDRPGLAERLPLPVLPARPTEWGTLLYKLGGGEAPAASASWDRYASLFVSADPNDLGQHVATVLEVAQQLGKAGQLPPAHKQRPPWLRPAWGRWRRAEAVRRSLDAVARSPATRELAALTAAARAHGATLALGAQGPSSTVSALDAAGMSRKRSVEPSANDPLGGTTELDQQKATAGDEEWGVAPEHDLPAESAASSLDGDGNREGRGQAGTGSAGAGSGTLGALHVVTPTPSDRSAYWQLRGALAPEIERLIERLRAVSDDYYASVPRRFQRTGRLDRSRLPAAMAGREATFMQFVHRPEPAHAICLLLDCSASMTTRAQLLREAAIVTEAAAAAVGAHVTAFSFGATWERMEPAAAGAPLLALGRELRPHGGTPFGPAVAAGAEWLARQPYKEKRLWVFSDGQWSARDRAGLAWQATEIAEIVVWVLDERAPEPPGPHVRIAAAPTLAQLVDQAPAYFWLNREP